MSNDHTLSMSTEEQIDSGDKSSDADEDEDEDEKNNSVDDLINDEETRVCK